MLYVIFNKNSNIFEDVDIYIYIYIYICIYMVFTNEGLFEVAIESWPE